MKRYSSREVLKILKADGWYEVNCVGDHHQYKHPVKKDRVILVHSTKDMSINDLKSIEKQEGLKFK